jgi:hypothetical protein
MSLGFLRSLGNVLGAKLKCFQLFSQADFSNIFEGLWELSIWHTLWLLFEEQKNFKDLVLL